MGVCWLVVVCECSSIWGGEGVPVGVGRMWRGHHQQCLGEGMRVCLQVCPCRSTLSCVRLEDGCPHLCVLKSVVLCVTVCACFRVASCFCVWGCLYCRAVAVCDAVTGCI